MLDVIILCGGRGTRMGSLTYDLPKTLVPIRDKPILWYIIVGLYSQGVRHFILPTGYKHEAINKYLLTINFPDIKFSTIFTGENTSISNRIEKVKKHIQTENFLIINGDCISSFNINKLIDFHQKKNNLVTLLTCKITSQFGLISSNELGVDSFIRDQEINEFVSYLDIEKKQLFSIYSGICCVSLNSIKAFSLKDVNNFEQIFFNHIIKLNRIHCLSIIDFWYAVETQKDFEILNDSNNKLKNIKDFSFYKSKLDTFYKSIG